MAKQIPLNLPVQADYSKRRFVPAQSNAEGLSVIETYPRWANRALALIGPAGSGKTHLGTLWAKQHDALRVMPDDDVAGLNSYTGRAIWIDTASTANESLLFALINMAIYAEIDGLLLTDRLPPASWAISIPDLTSRLGALQVARLEEPDDHLLSDVMQKLFLDRGLKVSDSLIVYLLARIDRSVDMATQIVDQLDKAAASEGVNVTRNFAAKYFAQTSLI